MYNQPSALPFDEVERVEPRTVTTSTTTTNDPLYKWNDRSAVLPSIRNTTPRLKKSQRQIHNNDEDDDDDDGVDNENNDNVKEPRDYNVPPAPVPTSGIDEAFCDFGPLPSQSLCEWQDGCGDLTWQAGTGISTNWLGGPSVDSTASTAEGG